MFDKLKKFFKENIRFIIFIIVFYVVMTFQLPYYIMAPGGTIDISNRVQSEVKKDEEGSLNLLYVSSYRATLPLILLEKIFTTWDIESIEDSKVSNETADEIDLRGKYMLDNSISNAIYAAYSHTDNYYKIKSKKNVIIGLVEGNNSDLKIGDLVLKINDQEINDINDSRRVISEADDTARFLVNRDGKEKEINVGITLDDDGNKMAGIMMVTNYEFDLDPEIELKFKKTESGSSGGLMLSLSIYNKISDEDIIRGRNISGTGTIDMNGNVGEIGGIKYKLMGAVNDGMDVILVPNGNYEECLKWKEKYQYDIEVVRINTFNDALEYLRK